MICPECQTVNEEGAEKCRKCSSLFGSSDPGHGSETVAIGLQASAETRISNFEADFDAPQGASLEVGAILAGPL